MKVFLYYEDNENEELHKTLKMTLPKSWKSGPTSKLLAQFVESYNTSSLGEVHTLEENSLHLATNKGTEAESLAVVPSNAIIQDVIPDRANVFVRHGPSVTLEQIDLEKQEEKRKELKYIESTVQCTRFGCKKRFPKGGPYPPCQYHVSPPVFHETAKFWSCCPQKKAYDWNDFENIPGCQTGKCSDVKEKDQKQFLGGTDLRAKANGDAELKSIDDFNKAQLEGEAAPTLDRLEKVMIDLGIEKELYDQVVQGIRKEVLDEDSTRNEAEALVEIKESLGAKLKSAMKSIAAEQLRIK
mmetsp:Transcript_17062/g.25831  ORF Transcript_17062/g.25831 Transcript_17062/m.25831 type:complete len:298 (+) Transcript_17062:78-971(+)